MARSPRHQPCPAGLGRGRVLLAAAAVCQRRGCWRHPCRRPPRCRRQSRSTIHSPRPTVTQTRLRYVYRITGGQQVAIIYQNNVYCAKANAEQRLVSADPSTTTILTWVTFYESI